MKLSILLTSKQSKLFAALCCCLPFIFGNAQENKESSDSTTTQTINFAWKKRTNSSSTKPYFEALKNAEYGVQRFSVLDQLIEYHTQKNNTDSVIHYANIYLKEVRNWSETRQVKNKFSAKAHYYLANGNFFNGLTDNAIKWYLEGLKNAEEANDTEFEYKNKLGLSKCYIQQNNADKAIPILKKSLLAFAPEFPSLKVENIILLGKAYRFKKEYDEAEMYYTDALKFANSINNLELQLVSRLELAKIAEANNDLGTAFTGYENTRNEAQANDFDAIYFEGSLLIAKYYNTQSFYDAAIMGLSMSYINAIDSENLEFQRETLELQAKTFAKKEDFDNAYAVMTQLFRVYGEISTKQQRAIIKELEIQYETLEKEKAITSLQEDTLLKEAELKRQKTIKNAFLIGFLIILIPIIALLYVYYQKIQTQSELSQKQEEINTQKVHSLVQEQELNLIKASLDGQDEERKRIAQELHDSIGGNLAGIKLQLSSLTKGAEGFKTITTQIDETYQLVRDISHTLIPKKFQKNIFTDLVKEYTQSISKTTAISVNFYPHPKAEINTIDEKIKVELFKILQELMTNTLKHAEAGNIDIHLNLIEKELSLLFEDNGKGFDPSKTAEGIGLQNIKSRIINLKGTIHIDSAENRGTVMSIDIPIS